MYIDSLTIAAIAVFVVAMGMFVKNCFIYSCILPADRKHSDDSAKQTGDNK